MSDNQTTGRGLRFLTVHGSRFRVEYANVKLEELAHAVGYLERLSALSAAHLRADLAKKPFYAHHDVDSSRWMEFRAA